MRGPWPLPGWRRKKLTPCRNTLSWFPAQISCPWNEVNLYLRWKRKCGSLNGCVLLDHGLPFLLVCWLSLLRCCGGSSFICGREQCVLVVVVVVVVVYFVVVGSAGCVMLVVCVVCSSVVGLVVVVVVVAVMGVVGRIGYLSLLRTKSLSTEPQLEPSCPVVSEVVSFVRSLFSLLIATFRVASLILQTPKLWLVGVATDRDARLVCLRFFSFYFSCFFVSTKKSKTSKNVKKTEVKK